MFADSGNESIEVVAGQADEGGLITEGHRVAQKRAGCRLTNAGMSQQQTREFGREGQERGECGTAERAQVYVR